MVDRNLPMNQQVVRGKRSDLNTKRAKIDELLRHSDRMGSSTKTYLEGYLDGLQVGIDEMDSVEQVQEYEETEREEE